MTWLLGGVSFAACAGCGALMALRLKRRDDLARQWMQALQRMETTARRGASLPDILLSGGTPFLQEAAGRLRDHPVQLPEDFLRSLPWDSLLTNEEKQLLTGCLRGLFAPHPDMQGNAAAQTIQDWQAVCHNARAARDKSAGLYLRLGVLAGMGCFILMC